MNWKFFTPKVLVITGIILFAASMRLLPHWPNFTPIAAIALFGGAHLGRRSLAFMIPIAAMLISDLILGLHSFMLPVYLSFALVVLMGNLIRNNIRIATVAGGAMASAILFFLVTNFAVWGNYSILRSGIFRPDVMLCCCCSLFQDLANGRSFL
jgi:hypothetical protein